MTTATATTIPPAVSDTRVYVASLGAYVSGHHWGENPPTDELAELAEVVDEVGREEWAAFMSYQGQGQGQTIGDLRDDFGDCFIGDVSPVDYAYDYAEQCGMLSNLPDLIAHNIDWEAVARNMELTAWAGSVIRPSPPVLAAPPQPISPRTPAAPSIGLNRGRACPT